MASLKLIAASGGSVTLVPSDTASNYTVTLPSSTSTILTTTNLKTVGGATLLGSGDVGTIGVAYGGTGATTLTGILKGNGTSAFTAATAGTDYLAPPSGTALLKANSGGALANATAGTDYLAPPSGTSLLKANSGGALANATAGTDYLAPPSGTSLLKANSGGALANATAGSDYVAPGTATNFTAPQRPSISSETTPSSNTVTWDLTANTIFRINLNANITTFNLTGTLSSYAGYQYQVAVRYNGGTTISWPATVKWTAGTAPTLTGTSGKIDVFNFVVLSNDGGTTFYLYCSGYSQNL